MSLLDGATFYKLRCKANDIQHFMMKSVADYLNFYNFLKKRLINMLKN